VLLGLSPILVLFGLGLGGAELGLAPLVRHPDKGLEPAVYIIGEPDRPISRFVGRGG
jgi:hypothetical protein